MSAYKLDVEIEGLPRMTNASNVHWRVRKQHADAWKLKVFNKVWPLKPREPLAKARVSYTRYSCNAPDSDGLVSGFKHVQDALVKALVLIDDKFDVIGMPEYKWEKWPRGKGKIRIRVESVETNQTIPKETK